MGTLVGGDVPAGSFEHNGPTILNKTAQETKFQLSLMPARLQKVKEELDTNIPL